MGLDGSTVYQLLYALRVHGLPPPGRQGQDVPGREVRPRSRHQEHGGHREDVADLGPRRVNHQRYLQDHSPQDCGEEEENSSLGCRADLGLRLNVEALWGRLDSDRDTHGCMGRGPVKRYGDEMSGMGSLDTRLDRWLRYGWVVGFVGNVLIGRESNGEGKKDRRAGCS